MNTEILEHANEQQIREFFDDAYAFATSFVKNSPTSVSSDGDHVMKEEQKQGGAGQIKHHIKGYHESENADTLRLYEVDFEIVKKFIKKAEKSFATEEDLRKSIDSLIDLFEGEFRIQAKTFPNTLMIWRAMLILIQFEEFMNNHDSWSPTLKKLMKLLFDTHVELRNYNQDGLLIEYLIIALNKEPMQNFVVKIQSFITISLMMNQMEDGIRWQKEYEHAIVILDVLEAANSKKPFKQRLDYKEFYNDAINKDLNLSQDFKIWMKERDRCRATKTPYDKYRVFSLCAFPWILDSAFKSEILKTANRINQDKESFNINPMDLLSMGRAGLHLMFEVRRDHILDDALRVISKPNQNFKKPLRVMFAGEPGIDEGGVRKEFFQLLTKQLFNPEYAMF
jgi:HECT-domain (ubiquitin-transferase)